MTIHEANKLIANERASKIQLVKCHEELCKEYGYVQQMTSATIYEAGSSRKILIEMQGLIEQIQQKLLKCTD